MSSINATEFYKANIDKEQEYVHVTVARPVKEGESVEINTAFGINAEVRAEENGYELTDYSPNKGTRLMGFFNAASFAELAIPANHLELAVPKANLTAEDLAAITPVRKGESLLVDTFLGIPAEISAPYDGFAISKNGSFSYMSNFEMSSKFNYAGEKFTGDADLIVTAKGEPTVKGIVLDKEVTFAFKAGEYTAPAGSFLYANANDEDGYTVQKPDYAQLSLRKKPQAAISFKP